MKSLNVPYAKIYKNGKLQNPIRGNYPGRTLIPQIGINGERKFIAFPNRQERRRAEKSRFKISRTIEKHTPFLQNHRKHFNAAGKRIRGFFVKLISKK